MAGWHLGSSASPEAKHSWLHSRRRGESVAKVSQRQTSGNVLTAGKTKFSVHTFTTFNIWSCVKILWCRADYTFSIKTEHLLNRKRSEISCSWDFSQGNYRSPLLSATARIILKYPQPSLSLSFDWQWLSNLRCYRDYGLTSAFACDYLTSVFACDMLPLVFAAAVRLQFSTTSIDQFPLLAATITVSLEALVVRRWASSFCLGPLWPTLAPSAKNSVLVYYGREFQK